MKFNEIIIHYCPFFCVSYCDWYWPFSLWPWFLHVSEISKNFDIVHNSCVKFWIVYKQMWEIMELNEMGWNYNSLLPNLLCKLLRLILTFLSLAIIFALVWNFQNFDRVQNSSVKFWIVLKQMWEIMKFNEMGWYYNTLLQILLCKLLRPILTFLSLAIVFALVWNFQNFDMVQNSSVKVWIVLKQMREIMKFNEMGWNYHSLLPNLLRKLLQLILTFLSLVIILALVWNFHNLKESKFLL